MWKLALEAVLLPKKELAGHFDMIVVCVQEFQESYSFKNEFDITP